MTPEEKKVFDELVELLKLYHREVECYTTDDVYDRTDKLILKVESLQSAPQKNVKVFEGKAFEHRLFGDNAIGPVITREFSQFCENIPINKHIRMALEQIEEVG